MRFEALELSQVLGHRDEGLVLTDCRERPLCGLEATDMEKDNQEAQLIAVSSTEDTPDFPLLDIKAILEERPSKVLLFKPSKDAQGYKVKLRMPASTDVRQVYAKHEDLLTVQDLSMEEVMAIKEKELADITPEERVAVAKYSERTLPLQMDLLLLCIEEPKMTLQELKLWMDTLADNQISELYAQATELVQVSQLSPKEVARLKN